MTERSKMGPLQIIAEMLPQGPDTWISDRTEAAMDILMALDRAGFVIHWRRIDGEKAPAAKEG